MRLYGLVGKITARPGMGDVLAAHLLEAATELEEVAGCYLYVVSRDPADADAIWVTEVWESAEAHRASLELVAVQDLIARARPIIAGMGERIELHPIGGKGLGTSGSGDVLVRPHRGEQGDLAPFPVAVDVDEADLP